AANLEAQGMPAAQAESQAQAQVQPGLDEQDKQIEDAAADQRKQADQPATAPSDRATETLVRGLRDDTIPAATSGKDMTADVGGTTAGYVDLADEISSRLVLTIAVVIVLSFLL